MVAATALLFAGNGRAHHSSSMFDISKPIWVKGTVTRYQPISPHALISLDQEGEAGKVQRWTVEGPSLFRLKRMGVAEDFLKAGDAIEICGFAFRSPAAGGSSRPGLHGHVLVMPNGKMRLFGPYGKIDNCIRPDVPVQTWVDFLNTDPLAREAWCGFRTKGSTGKTDEIDRLMAHPCN